MPTMFIKTAHSENVKSLRQLLAQAENGSREAILELLSRIVDVLDPQPNATIGAGGTPCRVENAVATDKDQTSKGG